MNAEFWTFFRDPMLIGFSIVVLAMAGCSSTDETIYPPDIVESIGSIPEATIAANDGGNISSQGEIVTSVLKPGSAGESIETTTTEEEVLADLIDFNSVYQNLGLKKITDIVDPVDGAPILYIATQDGIIYSLDRDETSPNANIFLDLRDLVSTQYNEEGLLGVAFDPGFGKSRAFYVYYIAPSPRRSVIARYVDHGYGLDADESSSEILLEIPQPFGNHNGGKLMFGPEGFLYIAVGDGGGANDPDGHAQNLETLLGSILRIDVQDHGEGTSYAIPETNPFYNSENYRSEIWAYGLRNPWGFDFDTESGTFWAADVGQELWEEVNKVVPAGNYGWDKLEGFECLHETPGCNIGTVLPTWTYGREQGCSVIGGVVYTGSSVPGLKGMYLFGDHCTGTIWAIKDGVGFLFVAELGQVSGNITAFGSDELDQLYVGTREGGIYRLSMIP
jgi:glucose/arabinose dehydrogenase